MNRISCAFGKNDGYWDGWIGVHGVGHSENVILYREHLLDDDGNGAPSGIQGDEIVDEQVGIHSVPDDHPGAYIDIEPPFGTKYHSNVHVGELHWGSDPTSDTRVELDEQTSLGVEVDWIEGHNPYQSKQGSESVISSAEENLGLYGIDATFQKSDQIEKSALQDIVKGLVWKRIPWSTVPIQFPAYISPDDLNAKELSVIENSSHDDDGKLHLLYANAYGADNPEYFPHDKFIPDRSVIGLEGHTGSPGQVLWLETTGRVPYGTVVFDNKTSTFSKSKKKPSCTSWATR